MKLIRHGKIFNPEDHRLPDGCNQFAQSPQTLIFKDFVRIYFSTRAVDHNNKFLSHVAYADMSLELDTTIRVSKQPVISLGNLGCFDEHGIFPFSPLSHGNYVYAYTTGWSRRISVSVETGIGVAVSGDNGETFQRKGSGPVLTASLNEPYLVADAFVRLFDGVFHMWYIFGTAWKQLEEGNEPERTYKIGHATSSDGFFWEKGDGHQLIEDVLGSGESQALPCVIKIDKRYHMFFCFRESFNFRKHKDRGYRLGYAWSDDLLNWTRDYTELWANSARESWDSDMQCYPHAFEVCGKYYLLYNGNEFGRYGFGLAEIKP